MKKKLKIIIPCIFIFLCIVFCTVVWFIQDSQLYYPKYSAKSEAYITDRPDTYQHISFTGSKGESYIGWMKKASDTVKSPATILLFGGNGMASSITFSNLDVKKLWGAFDEYNYIMIDYPGYGLSSGKPSEKAIYKMALETYDYISSMDNIGDIFIAGYSYGTSPAIYTAANRDTAGLILLAPFDNGTNLVNQYFNVFHGPLKLLVKNRLESDKYAHYVNENVLITVSDTDEAVANSLSENLSHQFPTRPEYMTVNGLSHNDLFYDTSVMGHIVEFIEQNR